MAGVDRVQAKARAERSWASRKETQRAAITYHSKQGWRKPLDGERESALMKEWKETTFEGDPITAVKTVMTYKSSGQLVLNISQGAVCRVLW